MDGNHQIKNNNELFWKRHPHHKKEKGEVLFSLTEDELKKCRYKIINQNLRLAECIVHKKNGFSHGLRLHPPHMWKLDKNGRLYHRTVDNKWERWYPKPVKRLKIKK